MLVASCQCSSNYRRYPDRKILGLTPVRILASALHASRHRPQIFRKMSDEADGCAAGDPQTEQTGGDDGGKKVKTICEGEAKILQLGNQVFYNKAQVTNRDISIAVLKYYLKQREKEIDEGSLKPKKRGKPAKGAPRRQYVLDPNEVQGVKIFEGLAATGLRSLRYSLELPGVGAVVACDLDEVAVEAMRKNMRINGEKAKKLHPVHGDARLHMLQHPCYYEALDLDPYGTPVQFLDSAVQSVSEGGLLLVTATDMAVLCGSNGEACHAKYGIYPLHKPYCHEMALRILLACIEHHANRYKRYIVPVVSLSIDFYVRVFVRVYTSPMEVKLSASKMAYVYQSVGCASFYLQRVGQVIQRGNSTKYTPSRGPVMDKCPETGSQFSIGGPIWAEPIHNGNWVKGILLDIEAEKKSYASYGKLKGLLTNVDEELLDCPLYLDTHDICRTVGTTAVSMDAFASAIINGGFRASPTHCNKKALKTDAPWDLIWDIARTCAKKNPGKRQWDPESYVGKLLAKETKNEIIFTKRSFSKSRQEGVTRFPDNPGGWGPKRRHGKRELDEGAQEAAGEGMEGVESSDQGKKEANVEEKSVEKRERVVDDEHDNGMGDSKRVRS